MKTWLKGLAVFVFSSVVTGLAATNLDPANFNFSKAGLAKLGSLVAIIGAKAVLLYLKQSPLPAEAPNRIVGWNKITGLLLACVIIPGAMLSTGCVNSWERNTYATLAAGKTLIDCAIAGYNRFDADIRHSCTASPDDLAFNPAVFYLPQTREVQQAIEKARQVQALAVQAFAAYAVAKVARDPAASLTEKQSAVIIELEQLPELLGAIRSLMTKQPQAQARPRTEGSHNAISTLVRLAPAHW